MLRSLALLALIVAACGGDGTSTTAPTTAPTAAPTTLATTAPSSTAPSAAPSSAPSEAPGGSFDPSQSDAGVAAIVTISNDARGDRDGTHVIYGLDADGSECSGAFEEPSYTVVAWVDDAPEGQIHRFGITVAAEDVPTADGSTTDITDGGVSFDFVSASGFGTQYTGNSTMENEGSSTIDVTRAGATLTFAFTGTTYDGVNFEGQFVCFDA